MLLALWQQTGSLSCSKICLCVWLCVNRIQTYAGGTAATHSCKSSKSHNTHFMHSSAMPLKVLIIISIVFRSCDTGCWLWMIIIISHSTMAATLLCHQQHRLTDQGWIQLENVFIQFNSTFQKHPSFDLCWHVTHWIIYCLWRATRNGRQSAIWPYLRERISAPPDLCHFFTVVMYN